MPRQVRILPGRYVRNRGRGCIGRDSLAICYALMKERAGCCWWRSLTSSVPYALIFSEQPSRTHRSGLLLEQEAANYA